MHFEKDDFWNCVVGAESIESFQKNIVPEFLFSAEVPQEVVKSFGIVSKLLINSYTDYDLLDPALTKVLSSFEMAVKLKYSQLTHRKWKGTLQELLAWFNDNEYFEKNYSELLNAIRSVRNSQAHPENSFGGGLGLLNLFRHCCSLTNDLWEDLELRKERNLELSKINQRLEFIKQNGGKVVSHGSADLIYDAEIIFINNRTKLKKYLGYYKRPFQIMEVTGVEKPSRAFLVFFEFDNYDYLPSGAMSFENADTELFSIAPTRPTEEEAFINWKALFNNTKSCWLCDAEANHLIGREWFAAKSKFHLTLKSSDDLQ